MATRRAALPVRPRISLVVHSLVWAPEPRTKPSSFCKLSSQMEPQSITANPSIQWRERIWQNHHSLTPTLILPIILLNSSLLETLLCRLCLRHPDHNQIRHHPDSIQGRSFPRTSIRRFVLGQSHPDRWKDHRLPLGKKPYLVCPHWRA